MTEPLEKITVYLDPDLKELIPVYLDNRRKCIDLIYQALDRKDFDSVYTMGHKMRGSGAGYGLDPISKFGYLLEKAANLKDAGSVTQTVRDLTSYLDRISIVYDSGHSNPTEPGH